MALINTQKTRIYVCVLEVGKPTHDSRIICAFLDKQEAEEWAKTTQVILDALNQSVSGLSNEQARERMIANRETKDEKQALAFYGPDHPIWNDVKHLGMRIVPIELYHSGD